MTEDEKVEMYRSLCDGDEWQCKSKKCTVAGCWAMEDHRGQKDWKCSNPDDCWRPFHLGDEFNPDWEYRKVKKYQVYEDLFLIEKAKAKEYSNRYKNPVFEGTYDECEDFIESKKSKSDTKSENNEKDVPLLGSGCEFQNRGFCKFDATLCNEMCSSSPDECTKYWGHKAVRRMKYFELADWLVEGIQKGKMREALMDGKIYSALVYPQSVQFDECKRGVKIRRNHGLWTEPDIEV